MKTILFLSANPYHDLKVEEESREIDEGLRRAKYRDSFRVIFRFASRPRDVRRAIMEIRPQFVHFSGHGTNNEEIIFLDESGYPQPVYGQALAGLFKIFQNAVECVVLNSCYSDKQAQELSKYVPYVVGVSQEISDRASIEFSIGFYDGLGGGLPIEDAFELGCNAILLSGGSSNQSIPFLIDSSVLLSQIKETDISGIIPTYLIEEGEGLLKSNIRRRLGLYDNRIKSWAIRCNQVLDTIEGLPTNYLQILQRVEAFKDTQSIQELIDILKNVIKKKEI